MKNNCKVWTSKFISLSMITTLAATYPSTLTMAEESKVAKDLIISEYLYGPSNSKAIEIFNGTGEDINLSEYDIATYFNGKYDKSPISLPLGDSVLKNGKTFVLYKADATDENFLKALENIPNKMDSNSQVLSFNGDDVIILRKSTKDGEQVIDSFGAKTQKGDKFYKEKRVSARRKAEVNKGEGNIDNTPFDINKEWELDDKNLYSDLGSHDVAWIKVEKPSKDSIDIGAAREKKAGEQVTVCGVVTYNDRGKTLHIQDGTGAIAVSNFKSKVDFSKATKGTQIEVKGVLDNFNNLVQVQCDNVKVLSEQDIPSPKVVTIKELNEKNFDSNYIEIEKATIDVENKTLKQGESVLDIYFMPTDINIKTGDLVNVKGVVGRFKDKIQLYGGSSTFEKIIVDEEAPKLSHDTISKANMDDDLKIKGIVTDDQKISGVKVKFKGKEDKEFKNAKVTLDEKGNFEGIIPKADLSKGKLEYYIEASDGTNNIRYPKEGTCLVEIVDEDLKGPELLNLSPGENSSVGENKTPTIKGNFEDKSGVDLSKVKVYLDNKDVSANSKISKDGFEYVVTKELSDGDHVVKVELVDNLGNKSEKEWNFSIGKLNHYYGQLHSHTNISDGTGSLDEAYEWARDKGHADYFAVTDHSNWFDNDTAANINDGSMSNAWTTAQKTSNEYNKDGEFVALYGYEMTWSGSTGGWGHINTFNTKGFETRKNKAMDLPAYYKTVANLPESISQLNHPGKTFGDFADFGFYSEAADKVVNLIEVGNGEGPIRGSGYFPSYGYYTRALDKGWHVAPTNNQDNHKGRWITANDARTIVLAEEKTREGIYDAMRKKQVYASEDKNMSIDYFVNGQTMGSNLGEPKVLNFDIAVNDKDSNDKVKKISIIANGGVEVISKEFNGEKAEWKFDLKPEYSYYYVKVVQEDKDIAVTAPVWIGENINCGLNALKSNQKVLFEGKENELSTEVYNNSSKDVKNVKVEFFNGEILEKNKIGESLIDNVASSETKPCSIKWVPNKEGEFTIYARATASVNGEDKIFTKSLKLKVVNEENVYKVMIDGAHYNQYVSGNYAGKTNAFEKLLIDRDCIPIMNKEEITDKSLEGVDILVITDPQGTDVAKYDLHKSKFTNGEIEAIKKYVDKGGHLIISSKADYKDGMGEYSNGAQVNPILEKIDSSLRINDDQVVDNEKNSGSPYRLMLTNYASPNYDLTNGVDGKKAFSFYSGSSVYKVDNKKDSKVDFLVKGYKSTETTDGDKKGDNTPMDKGDVSVLAVEELKNGSKVVAAGSTFFSDFEIDGTNAESKSNNKIVENIINWMLPEKELKKLTIKEFREDKNNDCVPDKFGQEYILEGTVTSQSEAIEPKNSFFEVIYIQDETGGIIVFGVSKTPLKVGQKVRVKGTAQEYQGEFEIQIENENEDLEIIDENINEIEPKLMTTRESMLHENEGLLTRVQGKVSKIDGSNLYIDDGSGESRVYLEGYIWDGKNENQKGKWNKDIKVVDTVSAIGLASKDPEGNRLRVRNTEEIVLNPKSTGVEETNPGNKEEAKPGEDLIVIPDESGNKGSGSEETKPENKEEAKPGEDVVVNPDKSGNKGTESEETKPGNQEEAKPGESVVINPEETGNKSTDAKEEVKSESSDKEVITNKDGQEEATQVDKENNDEINKKLPNTGSLFNSISVLTIGGLFTLIGAYIVSLKNRKTKR